MIYFEPSETEIRATKDETRQTKAVTEVVTKMANNGMSCLLSEVRFGFLVTLTFSDEHDQAKPRINRSKSSKFFRYL